MSAACPKQDRQIFFGSLIGVSVAVTVILAGTGCVTAAGPVPFEEVSLGLITEVSGVVACDCDYDGDEDLFISTYGPGDLYLLKNLGGGGNN